MVPKIRYDQIFKISYVQFFCKKKCFVLLHIYDCITVVFCICVGNTVSNTISLYLLAMDHLKCLNTKLAEVGWHINILSFNVIYMANIPNCHYITPETFSCTVLLFTLNFWWPQQPVLNCKFNRIFVTVCYPLQPYKINKRKKKRTAIKSLMVVTHI